MTSTSDKEHDSRWTDARKRVEGCVDAVLWQDFGIENPERKKAVDWILDEIFQSEYIALLDDKWSVWRQDDNGNQFEVESCLTYEKAKSLTKEYDAKGHKQCYWFKPTKKKKGTV